MGYSRWARGSALVLGRKVNACFFSGHFSGIVPALHSSHTHAFASVPLPLASHCKSLQYFGQLSQTEMPNKSLEPTSPAVN